ncbi:hypothetical protein MNBD_GAMMA10-2209, partial [hydrothermal vent metagenome]
SCSSCHNGTIATGAPTPHFSSKQCDLCHNTNGWGGVNRYNHSLFYEPMNHRGISRCSVCHTRNSDAVNYRDNPGLGPDCGACHIRSYDAGEHKGRTATELKNCSGACHEPGPEHRVSDPDWG